MTDKEVTVTNSKARDALFANKSDAEIELDRDGASPRWEASWAAGINPGELWDTTAPCKALSHLLHQRISTGGKDVFIGKKALVPGCGRAYVSNIMFV